MKAAILAVALLATGGCFRTKFQLQPPIPAMPSPQYDNHFHFNIINLIEISSPVNLQQACGGAPPAGIEEEVGVLGAIVNSLLSTFAAGIITVHNATVYCPAGAPMGGMQMGPPPPGGPAPMAPMGPQQPPPPQ